MRQEHLTDSEDQVTENEPGFRQVEDLGTEAETATTEATAEGSEFLDELDAELAELVAQIEAARSTEEVDQIEFASNKRLLSVLYERGEKLIFNCLTTSHELFKVDTWPHPVRAALLMDPPVETYGDFLARRASYPTLFRRLIILKDVLVGTLATAYLEVPHKILNALINFMVKIDDDGTVPVECIPPFVLEMEPEARQEWIKKLQELNRAHRPKSRGSLFDSEGNLDVIGS